MSEKFTAEYHGHVARLYVKSKWQFFSKTDPKIPQMVNLRVQQTTGEYRHNPYQAVMGSLSLDKITGSH